MTAQALRPVSIMDLTVDQLQSIETDPKVGVPLTEWDHAPSQAYLMAVILAAGNEVPITDVTGLTMRDLTSLVDFTQDAEDGPDPTPGSDA